MSDIANLFRALGVSRYDAGLREGRIAWRNDRGVLVARARCEVILSHASADDSIVYGAEHAELTAAGAPTVPLDAVPTALHPPGPMTEQDARRIAVGLAGERGAPFIYRCRFGMVSLYVAAFDLDILPVLDEPGPTLDRDALARYVGFMLHALHADPAASSAALGLRQLDRVLADHRDQLGPDDADRLRALLANPDAAALGAELRRWPEPAPAALSPDLDQVPP